MFSLTIKNRQDFTSVGKSNLKFHSRSVLLLAKKTPEKFLINPQTGKIDDFCRVGYTVSKKVGNSVVRNKIKRRLREIFKALITDYGLKHYDFVIIAKREAATVDFAGMKADLRFCMKNIKRICNDQESK